MQKPTESTEAGTARTVRGMYAMALQIPRKMSHRFEREQNSGNQLQRYNHTQDNKKLKTPLSVKKASSHLDYKTKTKQREHYKNFGQ